MRPLYDDQSANASAVTRDYVLSLEEEGGAPILSVYGGKITTYRKLSEHVLKLMKPFLPNMEDDWTERASLPGGDMPGADFEAYLAKVHGQFSWVPDEMMYRLVRTYGTRVETILKDAASPGDLGKDYGGGVYQRELDYVQTHEFARTADDVLMRRTKLGLHLNLKQIAAVKASF